jgi:hypothetical protein
MKVCSASLRGARNLNIFLYMPRFLRSVRLALHPAQRINQHFLYISRSSSSRHSPRVSLFSRPFAP